MKEYLQCAYLCLLGTGSSKGSCNNHNVNLCSKEDEFSVVEGIFFLKSAGHLGRRFIKADECLLAQVLGSSFCFEWVSNAGAGTRGSRTVVVMAGTDGSRH